MVLVITPYKNQVHGTPSAVPLRHSRSKNLSGTLSTVNSLFLSSIGYVVKPNFRPLPTAYKRQFH